MEFIKYITIISHRLTGNDENQILFRENQFVLFSNTTQNNELQIA